MPLHIERPLCGARNRKGQPCRNRVCDGRWRCRFHGGKSTGPRFLYRLMPEQREARVARAVAQMREGRRLWLAGLKARGEKAPCGRKPKGFAPLLASLGRCERERAKADAKRIEAPYRRFKRDCEWAERQRAEEERARAELVQAAKGRLRNLDPTPKPGESYDETPARYYCAVQLYRRDPARYQEDLRLARSDGHPDGSAAQGELARRFNGSQSPISRLGA